MIYTCFQKCLIFIVMTMKLLKFVWIYGISICIDFFYIEIIYTYHKLYHCNYFPVYSVVALCAITSLGKHQPHLSSELFSSYKTKTIHPHFPSPSHGSYHPIFCLYEFHYSRYLLQRRRWHPTPVLLPGRSHGWRSLVGCSPWGRWELDKTERLHFRFSLWCIGEGNGNPLQCSCLENPRDGGAWWAAVYGVTQSWTRLTQLSSSNSGFIHWKNVKAMISPSQ